jgi:flagellar biogenesis protein FliO
MLSEKQRTDQVFQQARLFKTVATVVAVILLIAVVVWGISVFMRNPQLVPR